ncbi:hypothetical protein G5714_024726 [Onychostoma macrolepis]|uniref:Uncharacterized protein n=1 Tax=Onychostoma macrolepis TaxID=369639 RepID=A0A7J6BI69_9TELE|nr:hypothetical protein G5714_024726 [Onychostoma macrolepis]
MLLAPDLPSNGSSPMGLGYHSNYRASKETCIVIFRHYLSESEMAVRGKVRHGDRGGGWRPSAEGGHLTKPSPQAPLARRTEPPRQDRRLSLPMNAGTRGAFARIKRTRRLPGHRIKLFSPCSRNTQPTAPVLYGKADEHLLGRAGPSSARTPPNRSGDVDSVILRKAPKT